MKKIILDILKVIPTRGISALGGVLLNYILALQFGAYGVGQFAVIFSIVGLFGIISKYGMDNAILRFASISYDEGDVVNARKYVNYSIARSISLSLFLATLMYFSSGIVASIINKGEDFVIIIRGACLILPPFVVSYLLASNLKSLGKAWLSPIFETGGISFLSALLMIALYYYEIKITLFYAVIIFSIFSAVGSVAAIYFVRKYESRIKSEKINDWNHNLILFKKPLFDYSVISFLGYLGMSGMTLVMSLYLDANEIGLISVAFKIALISNFILIIVGGVLAPKFSVLYKNKNLNQLKLLSVNSTRLMTLAAMPFAIVIFMNAEKILIIFGEDFIMASFILKVLILAQFFNVATGAVSHLLNMTGNEKINKKIIILNTSLSMLLCFLLTPTYGVNGAVAALSFGIYFKNILSVIMVYKLLGINVLTWKK